MSLLRRKHPALLVLEDGSVYQGSAFAGKGEVLGEAGLRSHGFARDVNG
ncbi:MAG: hypothetical protein Q7I93_02180 [Syntrophales bacterium]|nr:hypothetical protein [Syntrophales bacterium]